MDQSEIKKMEYLLRLFSEASEVPDTETEVNLPSYSYVRCIRAFVRVNFTASGISDTSGMLLFNCNSVLLVSEL